MQNAMPKKLDLLRLVIDLILVVGLAVLIGRTVWAVAAPQASLVPSNEDAHAYPAGYVAPNLPLVDRSILTRYDPFKGAVVDTETVEAAALDAPETSLNLLLEGVRAEPDGQGAAFIRLPDNRQIVLGVGEDVLDGVLLEYVFEDRVTLRTRGKLETLFRRPADQPGAIVTLAGDADTIADAEGALSPGNTNGLGRNKKDRAQAISAEKLLANARLVPFRENGLMTGYRISGRSGASVIRSIGIEPGDIITEINAQVASDLSAEDLRDIFNDASRLDLGLVRDGHPVALSVVLVKGTTE